MIEIAKLREVRKREKIAQLQVSPSSRQPCCLTWSAVGDQLGARQLLRHGELGRREAVDVGVLFDLSLKHPEQSVRSEEKSSAGVTERAEQGRRRSLRPPRRFLTYGRRRRTRQSEQTGCYQEKEETRRMRGAND